MGEVARRAPLRRDLLVRWLYAAGWRGAAHLPAPVVDRLVEVGSRLGARRGGPHVATLRANLAAATGRPVDDELVRAALASYLRALAEVLALPAWSPDDVVRRVRTVGEPVLREAYAARGAVVALPHSGNWDLAGAWAGTTGMPVTTVAERLGDAEYAAFLAFRRRLGMEVHDHRDPAAIAQLVAAVRRGRLVCLVGDRDLAGSGVPVRWRGQPVRMPAGPAVVARRSGAALVPAVCAYEGPQMVITFGAPVPPRPGRDGLVAMTQDVADFFAAQIARRPADWHMFQPFFGPVR